MSRNKKRISNLIFRKYDFPLVLEILKRKMGYYSSEEEKYNILLEEVKKSWIEHYENRLGKVGDKISFDEQ